MQRIKKKSEKLQEALEGLGALSDEELSLIKFVMPWQQGVIRTTNEEKDADGFDVPLNEASREALQRACWNMFCRNPYVGSSIKGLVGRLTGMGFEITSDVDEVQEAVDDTELDPRNGLWNFWPKYVGRASIEGELFLVLTVHDNGFIEVDFIDPSNVGGGGDDGIIYHPSKGTFPLYYYVTPVDSNNAKKSGEKELIPSINIAYFPDLEKVARDNLKHLDRNLLQKAKVSGKKFAKIGGYRRFMVYWDKSFVTRRNVSHLKTILVWLNHYENLKKYEIDHKKAAGAYLWVIMMEDVKAFRTWLALSDEERRKTGIMAKKTPGSTLVLPPGMKLEAITPKLPNISDSDTDILHMVTGGLDQPEDVMTGQSKGTFASVKASRGPMSDRISDEVAFFGRFLRFDFYRAVFFLKTAVAGFPSIFKIRRAVDFKNQKPVFRNVTKKPEMLIEISFPTSEVENAKERASAMLGVKHGAVSDVLGMPLEEIARKLGFGGYRRMRLRAATEADKFPELAPPVDSGGEQLDPGVVKERKKIVKKTDAQK